MAKAKKSKARKPVKAKAKSKSKTSAVAAKRAVAAKSARKAPAKKKVAARRPAAKKPAAKKIVATKTAAKRPPVRRAVSAPAKSVPVGTQMELPVPAAEPTANMGDGEASDDEDRPRRAGGIREAVASFATQAKFREAVKRLLAAGFAPTDLSILASHDSLEVAGGVPGYRAKPGQSLIAGLTEEAGLLAPLQVAGFSALSGGPVAGAVAALLTAGIGAVGLRDIVERFVANRHSTDYVAALKAGNLLLWVRVADTAREWQALVILGDCGGANAHINTRPVSGTS